MSDVSALARRLAETERRLRGLEGAARLTRASVVVGDDASVAIAPAVAASSPGPLQLATALQALVRPTDLLDFLLVVFYDDPEPDADSGRMVGDLWSDAVHALRRWDGTAWLLLADQSQAEAVAAANDNLATEDGRIVTYWQATLPESGDFGDLAFLTSAANLPHRWDGRSWVPLAPDNAQSSNYRPGLSGWRIAANGDAEFNGLTARGDIVVDNLTGAVASFSLRDWLEVRRNWLNASDTLALTSSRSVSTTANQYLTEATWQYDMIRDGLLLDEQDDLKLSVQVVLDVTCVTGGNTLIGELCITEMTAGGVEVPELRQFVIYGASGTRVISTQVWQPVLPGGRQPLGAGAGHNTYRVRLRVRSAGVDATYTVNYLHSALIVKVLGSANLGG